jgi:uncharacterized protein
MIKITVKRKKDNSILGFVVEGHAKYDKSGQDIVCSAVSALSYTTVAGLVNLAGGCDHQEDEGFMEIFLKEDLDASQKQTGSIILETMYIGFKQIENSYRQYIRINEKEV